jgi:hypothetical protein
MMYGVKGGGGVLSFRILLYAIVTLKDGRGEIAIEPRTVN